ncbi:MAG: hypothetical protein QXE32_02905 [Sulfolobales archaeon]
MIRRDIRSFFIWSRSSQIPLYMTPVYIILGVLIAGEKPELHGFLMVFAVRLFYLGVMWGQVPGFSGMMPHPLISIVILSSEIFSALYALIFPESLVWQITLWIGSIAHVIQYMRRGFGTTMRRAPNIIVMAGLILALTTPFSGLLGVLAFPLASVSSLLLRADPNMRKEKMDPTRILIYTAIFVISWVLAIITRYYNLILLPITALIFFIPKIGGRDIYRLGTSVSKIIGFLSFPISLIAPWGVSFHLAMIGFLGVTMISFCTPLLIPGIIWRENPKLLPLESIILVGVMATSAILRSLGQSIHIPILSALSGILVFLVALYYVFRILRMPSVPVKL